MIQSRRTTGILLALATFAVPTFAQDLGDLYSEGVDLLSRGRKEEALAKFQAILAADPTNEAAYELWKEADHQVFLDLIVEGGEYRLVAERMLARAKLGRTEHRNDADAVRSLVDEYMGGADGLRRRQIITELSAEHGPYAAPALVGYLAEGGDGDRRAMAMVALAELGADVVWPLVAALGSDNAAQRRAVAATLGNIGDSRAAGALEAVAALDADASVVKAAKRAAAQCGSNGDAVALLLGAADGYYHGATTHIRPFDDQNVVWAWAGGLMGSEIATAYFSDAMSMFTYFRALDVDAGNGTALAGIARTAASVLAKIEAGEEGGEAFATSTHLILASSGVDATDAGLIMAARTDDAVAGSQLCRTLGATASAPTAGLQAAVASGDPTLRGEAALALAAIATRTGKGASASTVAALSEAAGRDVLRVAAIIDGNAERAGAALSGLTAQGVMVDHRAGGIEGIVLLRRMPIVDIILVGDRVGGLTTDEVLAEIARNERLADVPVFLMSGDEDFADAMSDRVSGVVADAADLSALDDALSAGLDGDRAVADALGARAAGALHGLAQSGNTDCGGAAGALASTLAFRSDAVTVPAMHALASCGGQEQVDALLAVLGDAGRSDEARMAAATAAGSIGARSGGSDNLMSALSAAANDGGNSGELRGAAATALGMLNAAGAARTPLLRGFLTGAQG